MLSAPDFKHKQIIFALINQGEKLSFKNDNIVIKDADGKIRHQSTCYKLFAVFLVGHITVTSGLLQRSKKFGFSIILMTHSLRVYGVWGAKAEGNVILRKKQYNNTGLDIAAYLVQNKIGNQISTLKKIRSKDEDMIKAISSLDKYKDNFNEEILNLRTILGIEGIASRVYFKAMFENIGWTARRPRVKHDMINCLMDIGYTLLFNFIESLLNVYGFDLYKGVYHQEFYQRKSLVCDLVEPFRSIIDYSIRKAYNLGQCNEDDFDIIQGQYKLYGKNAAPYIKWLMESLIERKMEIFLYVRGYYRSFMKDKNIEEYPYYEING